MMHRMFAAVPLAAAMAVSAASPAMAKEYFIGGPVRTHDMEIVANYLLGVEMAPMMPGMAHGADVIHVEADVHATADNTYGYPDGAWIGYIGIGYRIEKLGTPWKAEGKLRPMQAKDGPHYADNVKMNGAGKYKVTYNFSPPDTQGYLRHTDKETGIPDWWKPFSQTFEFEFPQK